MENRSIPSFNVPSSKRLYDGIDRFSKPNIHIEWVKFESPYYEQWPPKHHTNILFNSPLKTSQPETYVKEVLKRFMSKAFRRPVKSQEVDHFYDIYKIAFKSMNSMEEAMKETLVMVLISPDFLYHVESNIAERKQFQLASKLSYFLWGTMPDDELVKLAREKKLNNPAVIQKQVERMLADKRSKRFIENFAEQWLSLDKAKTIPINRSLFPRFLLYFRNREIGKFWSIVHDFKKETVAFVAGLIKNPCRYKPFTAIRFPVIFILGKLSGKAGRQLTCVSIILASAKPVCTVYAAESSSSVD